MSDQTDIRPGLMRRVLAGVFGLNRPSVSRPGMVRCGCGGEHDVPVGLAAILTAARNAAAEVDGREWVPAFADRVKPDDVINIPRSDVAGRALRVLEVRTHDGEEFGGAARTFLAVDVADASSVFSPTISIHTGVRIAVAAPDSLADMAGGAA